MLLAVHAHGPGPGHAQEDYIHLVVDVLPDAPSGVEAHQVGVQVTAPFESPDHPCSTFGRRGEFVQIRRVSCQRSLLLLLGAGGMRDLETAARTLAAVAVLVDRHARQLGE
jgi:hypothetical protein